MDVGEWLRGLGLDRYAAAFREHDIDAGILPELTAEDLDALGVTSIGHRRKLLAAVAGMRAGSPPSTPRPSEAERRRITVMFFDLVGSTELSRRLDPEELREVIRAYQQTVAREVARFAGHVAKYMGDGVLAYFGWPRAHEDEAERAVRTGLSLVDMVPRLATPAGEPLAARVGIATGLVVVGDLLGEGAAREEAIVGETPNLAARLQESAAPGGVVVADGTRRLLGEMFALRPVSPTRLKGFAGPIMSFQVLGEREATSRFEAQRSGRILPMLGRDRELALLLERWWQAAAGEGQATLLIGEAGIGKSRLVRAMFDALQGEEHTTLRFQCSPHHTGSPLWPVARQLDVAAGFAPADNEAARLDKLEGLLRQRVKDIDESIPLLAAVLGIDVGARYQPLALTPLRQRARTLAVLVELLLSLAQRRPVLMVLEDAHWADPTTLALIGLALDQLASARVMMLLTHRPKDLPSVSDHPLLTRLTLSRLGRESTEAIVARLAHGRMLPAALLGEIASRTDGVPLFVEELTKAVLETGAGAAVPASLHASLMARLDRVPEAREVAQVAACIGREFAFPLLALISPMPHPELRAALDRLAAVELVSARDGSPGSSYAFKHALLRDAAHESLLKARRRRIHAAIVQALENHFPETADADPELLARHCTEAGLAQQAVGYWHVAGQRALARSAMAESVTQLTHALELLAGLPAERDRDRQELDLLIDLGRALIASKGWAAPEVAETYERARELCSMEAEHPQLLAALSGLQAHHLHRSGAGVGVRCAEELLRAAKRQRNANVLAAGHQVLGLSLLFNGQLLPAQAHVERALALYDPADRASVEDLARADIRVAGLGFSSLILLWRGYPDRAVVCSEEALAAARELGDAFTTSQALYLTCWLHQVRGASRIVGHHADAMMALATEHGLSAWSASAAIFHGWAVADSGAIERGIAQMQQGLSAQQALGVQQHIPGLLGLLAGTHLKQGDPVEALKLVDDALTRVDRLDERWFEAELHRLRGEALLVLDGEFPAEAELAIRNAIEIARRQGAKWWELRAAATLTRHGAQQDDRSQARDCLAQVYGWFTEGFDTLNLREAKALLEATAG
ncbi:MAG: adenylate/guanylate cyclase domain-containing protein [Geminicoccaceae bacterium]